MAFQESKGDIVANNEEVNSGRRFGVRHIQMIFIFLAIFNCYSTRILLSVGIVAMTDSTTTKNPDIPSYNWDNKSVILSSFFWGYITLHLVAGYLANKYGPKWFMTGIVAINSIACMSIPIMAATFGWGGVMACRIVQGLVQGFLYPCCHTLLGKWIPPDERATLASYAYSGSTIGTIYSMFIGGIISASWAGWPMAFYTFALMGILWIIPWICFGFNTPSEHPRISNAERKYIEASLDVGDPEIKQNIPWKYILTSIPIWALTAADVGNSWGHATMLTELPNYINKIMKFDMHSNGLWSAAPYIAQLILTFIFGPICDLLINRNILTRGAARKLFQNIGMVVPAIALTVLALIPEDKNTLSVVLLLIAVGINAATHCGCSLNMLDLSPNFSGAIMSIINLLSNIPAILAPLLVQIIVTDESDKYQWRTIFFVSSISYVLSGIIYYIFGSGQVQQWNDPSWRKKRKQNKNIFVTT